MADLETTVGTSTTEPDVAIDEAVITAPDIDRFHLPTPRRSGLWILLGVLLGIGLCLAAGFIPVTASIRIPLAIIGLGVLVHTLRLVLRSFGVQTSVAVILALAWMILLVGASILADWLPLPEARDPANTLTSPIMLRPGLGEHLLGTDRQGLDILGGIVYGSRVSLVVGVGAAVIAMIIGGLIGMIAGFFQGLVDRVVQFFMTSLLAFPPLILLMGMAAVLDPSVPNVTLALIIVVVPVFARVARGATMVVAQQEYIQAATVLGSRSSRILIRDVAPAIAQSLISYALVMVSMLVVAEASLSYLGLGIPRPEPTLGNMISAGKDQFDKHPHLVFAPAVALFLTVLSLNLLGEYLRRVWDRREARV